jgi:hypothetical protein
MYESESESDLGFAAGRMPIEERYFLRVEERHMAVERYFVQEAERHVAQVLQVQIAWMSALLEAFVNA